MIDASTIESIGDRDIRFAVKAALVTLVVSGVFELQHEVEKERLIGGNSEQSIQELAGEILEFRKRVQALQTIQQLGQYYQEEVNS